MYLNHTVGKSSVNEKGTGQISKHQIIALMQTHFALFQVPMQFHMITSAYWISSTTSASTNGSDKV